MHAAPAPRPDKERVGYSARRVLSGRGCAQLGEFAPIRCGSAACRSLDLARSGPHRRGAAGLPSSAASITQNQALSAALQLAVAWPPSHGRGKGEESQALKVPGGLIASYRTRRLATVDPAQLGALEADPGRGGATPSRSRARPYTLSRPCDLGSAKIRPAALRPSAGCAGAAEGPDANDQSAPLGSGVRGARKSGASGARKALGARGRSVVQNRVRVRWGGHAAFDLARVRTLGGGWS